MRRLSTILILAAVIQAMTFAQTYPHVSIRDIQEIPDSILALPSPNTDSPLLGDTVWVTGVVVTSPRLPSGIPQWYTGPRWRFVLKDPSDSVFNYLTVVTPDTSFFKDSVAIDLLVVGDSIELLGKITEYRQLTQFEPISVTNGMNLLGVSSHEDVARVVPLSDLYAGEYFKWTPGEKYESGFIRLENLTVLGPNGFEFTVADALGNQIIIDDQSMLINTGSGGVTPPPAGAKIDWVQGYTFTNSSLGWTLNPRSTSDYQVGVFGPSIDPIVRSVRKPGPADAVGLTTHVVDQDGTVTGVSAYYRVNGTWMGSVVFTQGTDSVWSGTLPASGGDSAFVDFYIIATDNEANATISPSDTTKSRHFYLSLNRDPRIADVQYNPFGGESSFLGDSVSVRGVVTADRTNFGALFIQDGAGKWSGIRLAGLGDDIPRRADDITATGVVGGSETNLAMTTLLNATFVVHSSGNPVPGASAVLSTDVKTGGPDAEAYESVLIELNDVFVVNMNPDIVSNANFGEFSVFESKNVTSGFRVDDFSTNLPFTNDTARSGQTGKTQLHLGDSFASLRGILRWGNGDFKLIPRDSADFIGYQVATGVEKLDGNTPASYGLAQNFPNPFNPTTVIEYSIGQTGNVSLELFNVLGQRIASLVNGQQPAGTYRVSVSSDTFRHLSSGMYFYVLRSGSFTQTKRMVFLK